MEKALKMRTCCSEHTALNRQLSTRPADRRSAVLLSWIRADRPSSCTPARLPACDVRSTSMPAVQVTLSGCVVAATFLLSLSLNSSFHTCEIGVLLATLWRRTGCLSRERHPRLKPSLPGPSPCGPRADAEGPSLVKNTNLSSFCDRDGSLVSACVTQVTPPVCSTYRFGRQNFY